MGSALNVSPNLGNLNVIRLGRRMWLLENRGVIRCVEVKRGVSFLNHFGGSRLLEKVKTMRFRQSLLFGTERGSIEASTKKVS